MYPPQLTDPMRAELRAAGLTELTDDAAVNEAVAKGGSMLLLVNSVCGCAAKKPHWIYIMRLLVRALVLEWHLRDAEKKPDQAVSVFAGVDPAATAAARGHFAEFPPSSPSIFLLKDGEPVWAMHRHQIEGRHAEEIAGGISAALAEFC